MTRQNERKKLIDNIVEALAQKGWTIGSSPSIADDIADFIVADRKRICKPLVKIGQIKKQPLPSYEFLCQAIDETLTLAGVGKAQ